MARVEVSEIKDAFVQAAQLTFSRMLQMEITEEPTTTPGQTDETRYEISAIIGFVGDIIGNVALRFSGDAARAIVSRFVGESVTNEDEISDGVGELVNVIAGNAKASLQNLNERISLPEVIRGKGHSIDYRKHAHRSDVLLRSELGQFGMVVAWTEDAA